jgi:pyruvate dehydrogenase E1 component alpha subunit
MSDPATYRTKDELSNKKEDDPILKFKDVIIKDFKITDDQIKEIDNEIKQQISDIVEFSKNSPQPDESELLTDIYH